jgi:hypothetical protein
MTTLRIWFDLAEVDTVLNDQRAVRKSIWAGLRHTLRSLPRLLFDYVIAAIFAGLILVVGVLAWMKLVAPESLVGAFLITQITLFLLLIPRFWQRGVAVTYWLQQMAPPPPVIAAAPVVPVYPHPAIEPTPEPAPLIPDIPPSPQES